ncbi:MAG: hypothetical protein JXN59_13830, partial [Anaerolineae bacterium]|nr:hypothetical protein [Anaerolineae bacterium]
MKNVTLLVLLSVILALAACTSEPGQGALGGPGADQEEVSGRPTIQMNVEDTAYDGLEGAYCWYQAANDIKCEPGPLDPSPPGPASVMPGDILTFTVGSESGTPNRLTATLLDDLDDAGQPVEIALENDLAADYTVDLKEGQHRIKVVAEFTATENDTNFVTTFFAIDVGEAVALEPTETAEPAEDATAAETADAEATASAEETAEAETSEATEAAASVMDATSEPTALPPTEVPPTNVPPTEEPTALPPTEAPPTEVPPTEVPTQAPTAVPPTTVPTAVPPSPVPPPTLPPTVPAAADSFMAELVPEVVIVKGDDRYEPAGVEFCVADSEDCQTLTGGGADAQIMLASGDTVRIDLGEGGPTRMIFSLTDTAQTQVLDRLELRG